MVAGGRASLRFHLSTFLPWELQGGGRATHSKILTLLPSSVEVSPKLCPTLTHHLEWPGLAVPNRITRWGWRESVARLFPYQWAAYISKIKPGVLNA